MSETKQQVTRVSEIDARNALIYRDGILDYDAHDAYLRAFGYEYADIPCNCDGNDDDGHMPCCGWAKLPVSEHQGVVGDENP